ncbi:S41 family peptidase [Shewanella sp. NIFS-20-20]|uniref:S41 family peptidase n=1 Tax=Shewanella sp. NIFS-20-20 TaxID=2853806 RepID=UPI001C466281|nr:S41 family peptidase [Shewanella sp. NIFS-20-20]MBV7315859.1 hypothetical protein [Shewanella sp. NIFS-20-20]
MKAGYRSIYVIFLTIIALCVLRLASFHWPPAPAPEYLSQYQVAKELADIDNALKTHSAFVAINTNQHWLTQWQRWQPSLLNLSQDGITVTEYQLRLSQILSQLNDPNLHLSANHQAPTNINSPTYHDYQLSYFNGHYVAKQANGRLLHPKASIVTHIDGLPLRRWLALTRSILPHSQQQDQVKIAQLLSQAHKLRPLLGVNPHQPLRLTLTNSQGEQHHNHITTEPVQLGAEQPMQSLLLSGYRQLKRWGQPALQGAWFNQAHASEAITAIVPANQALESGLPLRLQANTVPMVWPQQPRFRADITASTQVLDGEHWLLTLANFAELEDHELQHQLRQALQYYPNVIIDIRHGFGRSQALLTLLNQQYGPQQPQLIGTSQYRLSGHRDAESLNQLGFVKTSAAASSTMLSPPLARYLPASSRRSLAQARVILIAGPECIQECEWLLVASRHWSRVHVIGQATQGRTALTKGFALPYSQLTLNLSTSVEFDADEQAISAIGIAPVSAKLLSQRLATRFN